MSGPRYVVKAQRMYPSLSLRWRVWDNAKPGFLTGHSASRRTAEKRADRYNASILKQADDYRKAKDNG